jgi:hypothetical protein
MHPLSRFIVASGVVLLAFGCATTPRRDPAAQLAKVLEGRVAGPPVSCINLPQAQGSQVIDHTAIVYDFGSTIYVNYPGGGADSLSSDDILVTKTPSSQLCKMDIVRMVDRSVGFPKGFVSLGPFIPYKRPAAAN